LPPARDRLWLHRIEHRTRDTNSTSSAQEIRHVTGVPATSATNSIFAACVALGMKRVTAISPYPEAVDAAEHRFFAEGGVGQSRAPVSHTDGFRLAEPAPEAILDLALGAWDPASDGIIIALPQFPLAPDHRRAGSADRKPVVTSTQATCGTCCGLPGSTPIPGYGRLLREH